MNLKAKESWGALLVLLLLIAVTVFFWSGVIEQIVAAEKQAALSDADTEFSDDESDAAASSSGTFSFRMLSDLAGGAEAAMNKILDRDHLFIQLYGGVQRLCGRQIMEDVDPRYDVIRTSDGSLTFVEESGRNMTDRASSLLGLSKSLSEMSVPLLYIQAPEKLAPGGNQLPAGVGDYGNAGADQLLSLLKGTEVDTLDLRRTLLDSGEDWSSLFYKTDHHWNTEGAFLAWQAIADRLRERYCDAIPEKYTDRDAYDKTIYPNWFLGSQGKRVGSLYGGTDDVALWKPEFITDFSYSAPVYDILREGPFETSLLFPERLESRDLYNSNPYTLYSGGDFPSGIITNRLNPGGPTVILLRDSYACGVTPFLALGCGTLITFDLRYWQEDDHLSDYIKWLNPDLVAVLYTPGCLQNDLCFRFD